MPSLSESLTENFYHWEKRGRGWKVWDAPVELEPGFAPFVHSYSGTVAAPIDDGRKLTRVGTWLQKLKGNFPENVRGPIIENDPYIAEPQPDYFLDESPLIEIQISLSPEQQITKQTAEQFILSLTSLRLLASFEIIGTSNAIVVQIGCREPDSRRIQQQLRAYFPDAVISHSADYLSEHWSKDAQSVVIDFGLSQEFMRPLRVFKAFEVDPLIGLTGALSNLDDGEVGILQVLFQPARKPWADSIGRSVTDGEGHSFFIDAPEMVGLAREKLEYPLFASVIRIGALANSFERTRDIAISLGGALAQFSRPGSNELIPLENDEYDDFSHEEDLLLRQSRRSGMLLNASELVSLAHLPSVSVRSEKLKREIKRSKAAPSIAIGHPLKLGENTHQGKTITVGLNPEQRLKHTYVIGATGTGKSTLLLNMIVQDIENGTGVGVLDPQGDLIDAVLERIPEKRFDDVILFDPADTEFPVGFNILSAHSEVEKNILSSDLGAVFKRLATSWGDQMTSVLGNAILAFLESERGGTVVDLRKFLIDQEFRTSFLKTVKDPEVKFFWQKEFPILTGRPHASVLTRLDTFLRPKLIRNMVAQKENRLNFRDIVDGKTIFLVKLAQGLIGEENAYLLGSFIVSKLHQVAMARQDIAEKERKDFFLYIDEFHNFITPSMSAILSGARKYHMGLILAHQELHQLWNRDTSVANSVIANPFTRICFRLGDFDAKKLEDGFSYFRAEDLQNLGVGEAICRVERNEYDFNLKTRPLPEVDSDLARYRLGSLIVLSREKYATRRADVEADLFKEEPVTEPPPRAEQNSRDKQREARQDSDQREDTDEPQSHPETKPDEPKPSPRQGPSGNGESESPARPNDKPQATRPRFQTPPTPGKGGQQHKYLQNLIKRLAEDRGYKATIEQKILGGVGSVDVSLERNGKKQIACEICITTNVEHELANIQKCLAAGFEHVVLVSTEKKTLHSARELALGSVAEKDLSRIQFLTPEEFISFLEHVDAKAATKEQTVRGYKVKVKYKAVNETEKKARKKVIAETVLQALRKMKENN